MNILFSVLIITAWVYIAMSIFWSPTASFRTNMFFGLMTIIFLGLIHWIPFWLIFMKG